MIEDEVQIGERVFITGKGNDFLSKEMKEMIGTIQIVSNVKDYPVNGKVATIISKTGTEWQFYPNSYERLSVSLIGKVIYELGL